MKSAIAWLALAVGGGLIINALLFRLLRRRLTEIKVQYGVSLKKRFSNVLRLLIPLFLVLLVVPSLPVNTEIGLIIQRFLSVAFIMLLGWFLVNLVLCGRDLVLHRYNLNVKDNLKARMVHTQVKVLVRILVIVIILLAVASAMMIFDNVRQVGTSILASAGVIGIIIGFAAQRSLATILAGLQLAITQPVRIDDVVIVDGEWGQIEEITLTYVVVRIWDLRRLVVPTSHFLEKTFQNWTRTSADLLATVTLHVDYRLPVEVLRQRLSAILEEHPLWDKQVWRLQVIDATPQTLQLRALMSAANSSNAWELRCDVRERLLDFLQENYPQHLPRIRAELHEAEPDSSRSQSQGESPAPSPSDASRAPGGDSPIDR